MARDETEEYWRATAAQPPIVIAIEEIADVEDDGTTLELLGSRGASPGILLLAARSDGAMPKDQILAALWSDTDEEYAMQNLHQTGSRLRRSLRSQVPDVDDDVVCNGRDGIYRLDPAHVWSDAHRFGTLCSTAPKLSRERAIAALHQARRLYRAELLADQAYKWPTDRFAGVILRTHYAELYRQATCRMARLLCEEGQTGRAVSLYKGLLKLEPTVEDVVRGL